MGGVDAFALQELPAGVLVEQAHDLDARFIIDGGDHVGVADVVDPGDVLVADAFDAVVAETEQAVTQQIDYEDGALCVRFGFAAGSATYLSCKLDLLDLRRRHEELLTARSMP